MEEKQKISEFFKQQMKLKSQFISSGSDTIDKILPQESQQSSFDWTESETHYSEEDGLLKDKSH